MGDGFDISFTKLPPDLQMKLWVLALDANTSKVSIAYKPGAFTTSLAQLRRQRTGFAQYSPRFFDHARRQSRKWKRRSRNGFSRIQLRHIGKLHPEVRWSESQLRRQASPISLGTRWCFSIPRRVGCRVWQATSAQHPTILWPGTSFTVTIPPPSARPSVPASRSPSFRSPLPTVLALACASTTTNKPGSRSMVVFSLSSDNFVRATRL